jgi:hypothetical protein
MLDIPVILIVALLVLSSNRRIAGKFGPVNGPVMLRFWNKLFFYHFGFSCLFPLIPGDSLGYWNFGLQQITTHSDKMTDYFGVGTIFLLFLDFIPVKVLGLSFFTGNFLYGVLGFMGLRYLSRLLGEELRFNVRLFGLPVIPYLFYLPNLNFWTAGVGKDTLCFYGIALFLFSLRASTLQILWLFLSFCLVYCVRPHVGMMMIAGTGAGILFSKSVRRIYKFMVPFVVGGIFLLLYKQVAAFLRIDDLSTKSLTYIASNTATVLRQFNSGSSIDISSYPMPLRIFTYLYRPLFFDVHNFITLFSSLENLVYLGISFIGFRALKMRDFNRMPFWMVGGAVIFLISVIVFANSLGNLGIIMRMKNMTMIYFLIVMVWGASERKAEEISMLYNPRA